MTNIPSGFPPIGPDPGKVNTVDAGAATGDPNRPRGDVSKWQQKAAIVMKHRALKSDDAIVMDELLQHGRETETVPDHIEGVSDDVVAQLKRLMALEAYTTKKRPKDDNKGQNIDVMA